MALRNSIIKFMQEMEEIFHDDGHILNSYPFPLQYVVLIKPDLQNLSIKFLFHRFFHPESLIIKEGYTELVVKFCMIFFFKNNIVYNFFYRGKECGL